MEAMPGDPELVRTESAVSGTLRSSASGNTVSDMKNETRSRFTKSFPANEISDDSDSELDEENWEKKQQNNRYSEAKIKVRFITDSDMIRDVNESVKQSNCPVKQSKPKQPKYWIDYYESPSPPFPQGLSSDEAWSPLTKNKENIEIFNSERLRKTGFRKALERKEREGERDSDTDESDTDESDREEDDE